MSSEKLRSLTITEQPSIEVSRIGDLLDLVVDNRGKTPPISDDGIYPLVEINSIVGDKMSPNLDVVSKYVDVDTYLTWFRKGHPKRGDVLFSTVGSIGEIAYISSEVCCIAQNIIALRPNRNLVIGEFLYYLLSSKKVKNQLLSLDISSVQPSIKLPHLLDLEVEVPSLESQERVIQVLSKLDQKIKLNRQVNQTLEQIAQAMFKSWFVDFEPTRAKIAAKEAGGDQAAIEQAAMCAISGKTPNQLKQSPPETLAQLKATAALFPDAIVDSELGEIPEGWEVGTLAEFCHLNESTWSVKNVPDDVYYVDLANTKNGTIEDVQHYSWEEAPSRARRILKSGDTIIGTVRPGNRSFALIGETEKILTASTGFAVLSPKKPEYTEMLYLASTSDVSINRLAHLADGGAYPAVRPEVVIDLELVTPSEELIGIFSKACSSLFEQMQNSNAENIHLGELRDLLLPKLLSGEVSIPSIDGER